jgi:hypothetical protein
MQRQNISLMIEQELLEEAHLVAVRRHTSVNELVRQFLKSLLRLERERLEAWTDVRKLVERHQVRLGAALPGREDLHAR